MDAATGRPRTTAFADAGPPRPRPFRMVNVIGLISLIRREAIREMRWFGLVILGPAIQAVLFASVFTLAAGSDLMVDGLNFIQFLAAGLVASAAMQRAFETTGYSIMFDKLESGGMQDILSAPLSPMEVLVSYLVTAVTAAVSVGAVIGVVMIPFGFALPSSPVAAFLFLCLAAGIFSMAGLINAIFSPKWDSFAGKETFMMLPIIFLSGTFFPISAVPEGAWRIIFQVNPIYYLVDGFRWAATGRAETDPLIGAGIGVAVFLVLFGIAARLLATGHKIKA